MNIKKAVLSLQTKFSQKLQLIVFSFSFSFSFQWSLFRWNNFHHFWFDFVSILINKYIFTLFTSNWQRGKKKKATNPGQNNVSYLIRSLFSFSKSLIHDAIFIFLIIYTSFNSVKWSGMKKIILETRFRSKSNEDEQGNVSLKRKEGRCCEDDVTWGDHPAKRRESI